MRLSFKFICIASCAMALASCGGSGPLELPAEPAPKVVSTNPADGASGLKGNTLSVVVTMDQNIKVSAAGTRQVTVSGNASVASVNAYGKEVTIKLEGLENGGSYTVTVPAGVIEGFKENQEAAAAVSVRFSMEYVEPEKHYGRTPSSSLSDPSSTAPARKLYAWLLDQYGTKTLSGAMGGTAWETSYTDNLSSLTGIYPAIVGFDYLFNNWQDHKSEWPGRPDYTDITPVKLAWDAHNIIQIGWHWCVPQTTEDAFDTSSGKRYIDSYSYNTRAFGVANALKEGTWQNTEMKKQIRQIAGFLSLLQDAGIPVLWRPLHEAAGDYTWGAWFWWGYDGADACKQLWRYLYRELTETYGLHNLIWVWTTETNDDSWYPGDDYVDIIGRDIYNQASTTTLASEFSKIQRRFPHKIVTLSECGSVATINNQWQAGARWSWFMPWYDAGRTRSVVSNEFNSTNHQHANITWWNAAFGNRYVLTRDDLPDWK